MKYLKVFDTTAEYNAFKLTENFATPNVSLCEDAPTVMHYEPYVAPIVPQHEYVEIAGIKWATMNIGASSVTDYGLYFQWGDTQGYTASQVGSNVGQKYFEWIDYKYGDGTNVPQMAKYNSTDKKTVLEVSDDAVTAAWGGSWRMPTTEEFVILGNSVNSTWTTDYQGSGISGFVLSDKNDNSKVLFLPAGGRCEDTHITNVGSDCYYWSNSLYTSDSQKAYYANLYGGGLYWKSYYGGLRKKGFSIRGVLDE